MRLILFASIWLFVACAAAYDAHFAWEYRAVLQQWEQNPVALWAAQHFGLLAVMLFKFASVGFAAGIALYLHARRDRLEVLLTLVSVGAYGILMLHYLAGYQEVAATQVALLTR